MGTVSRERGGQKEIREGLSHRDERHSTENIVNGVVMAVLVTDDGYARG